MARRIGRASRDAPSDGASRRVRPGVFRNALVVASIACLAAVMLLAGLAPLATPFAPDRIVIGQGLLPPSSKHWLGTDQNGRDEFARLLYGGRISLAIGIVAMSVSVAVGTAVGAAAGFFGATTDAALMRLTDAMLSIPVFFLLLTALAVLGPTMLNIVLVIGLTSWMPTARVVRSEVLRTVNLDFVAAARALGAGRRRIILRHLLPHAAPSMLVASTLNVGTAILTESALSYLGVGVQPPTASWGNMLSNSQSYIFSSPLLVLWPGAMILIVVLAVNFVGDAMRDLLSPT